MRTRALAVGAVLAVALGSVMLSGTASDAAAKGGVWGSAIEIQGVPGQVYAAAISCASPGDCGAVGSYIGGTSDTQGFVVDEKRGVWGRAHEVPGSAGLNAGGLANMTAVSCVSPGNCAAGGFYADASQDTQALVVDENGGVWGVAREVPGTAALNVQGNAQVNSLSCPAVGDCVAGGTYAGPATSAPGLAFVADESGGAWGRAQQVPGTVALSDGGPAQVASVSCTSAGNCTAVGEAGDQAFIADETGGTWQTAQAVPGLAALSAFSSNLESVSCASGGGCTAVGYLNNSQVFGVVQQLPLVVSEQNGTWGNASALPVPATVPSGQDVMAFTPAVSCASTGNCAAGGSYEVGGGATFGFVADERGGTWDAPQQVQAADRKNNTGPAGEITSVSCATAGNCGGVGLDDFPTGNGIWAYVINEVNGAWETGKLIYFGAATQDETGLGSISCTTPANCGAVGGFTNLNSQSEAMAVDETPVLPTTTTLFLSPAKVTYGHEQAERASVLVSASLGIPFGKVRVKEGSGIVCKIALSAGKGSCTVGATRFAAGTVKLTASYGGATSFRASASATKAFTVTKAATRTSLTLARATVTYGHERAERLSVSARARYSGTPSGKVTVTAGRTTVCTITLKSARGSCRLGSRTLRPGTYHLVATYPGSANFDRSSSTAKTLKVIG